MYYSGSVPPETGAKFPFYFTFKIQKYSSRRTFPPQPQPPFLPSFPSFPAPENALLCNFLAFSLLYFALWSSPLWIRDVDRLRSLAWWWRIQDLSSIQPRPWVCLNFFLLEFWLLRNIGKILDGILWRWKNVYLSRRLQETLRKIFVFLFGFKERETEFLYWVFRTYLKCFFFFIFLIFKKLILSNLILPKIGLSLNCKFCYFYFPKNFFCIELFRTLNGVGPHIDFFFFLLQFV